MNGLWPSFSYRPFRKHLQFFQGIVLQNHRIVEVGRDLWRSTTVQPPPKAEAASRLPRSTSRWVLNISKGGDYYNLSGQPVPVLSQPDSKNMFSCFQVEFHMTHSVHIISCPVMWQSIQGLIRQKIEDEDAVFMVSFPIPDWILFLHSFLSEVLPFWLE